MPDPVNTMNVQVIKTKAETALVDEFHRVAAKLPGDAALGRLRDAAIGRFTSKGLPHRRIEEWKYTDLRAALKEAAPLAFGAAGNLAKDAIDSSVASSLAALLSSASVAVFLDGDLVRTTGEFTKYAKPLDGALADWAGNRLKADDGVAGGMVSLNAALMTAGLAIDIPDGTHIKAPLHIVHARSAAGAATVATRVLIRVGKGCTLTLVEEHLSAEAASRQAHSVVDLVTGDQSNVHHIAVTETGSADLQVATTLVELGAHATYAPFQMTLGTGLVRNDLTLTFAGEHSSFDFGAAVLVHGRGHADTTMVVDHAVPHCTSRELFKAVLDNDGRAVFQGKVIVRPDAQKTDGKQMAQALLLSETAEFDSKPELEIYADDVVCGHGSTSAEIDPDLVFYCRTRGIPLADARRLLIESFAGEAIDKVQDEALRGALEDKFRARLHAILANA